MPRRLPGSRWWLRWVSVRTGEKRSWAFGKELRKNATVVGELLGDLMNRGYFDELTLYVADGGKALHAAVKKYVGESAPIQRCQVHKRRNVLDHLTDEQAEAKDALRTLHRELMDLNPSAARSMGEGLEETLTLHWLHFHHDCERPWPAPT